MALTEWEYKEYKNAINKEVYKYVDKERDRGTLISLITDAIDTGSKKRKLEDKLLAYVDKNVAYKLADKAFMVLEDLSLKVKNSNKRSHKDENQDKDAKRARKEEKKREKKEGKSENKVITASAVINDNGSKESKLIKGASTELQAQQIRDCMAKAQAAIELRKKQLAIQTATLGNLLPAQKALSLATGIPNSIEVASRIAQLQARIQVQLGNTALPPVPTIPAQRAVIPPLMSLDVDGTQSPEDTSKPTPLILDDKGRTVDTSGKEVHYTHRAPTLKANIRAKKREEFKQQFLEKPIEEVVEGQFFDPRVLSKPFVRLKRGFKFHEKGKFIQVAQRERAKSRLEKLQGQISTVAKRTGISSAAKLAQLEQRDSKDIDQTPEVEWWDSIILQNDRYPPEGDPVRLKEEIISCLVEHPMEMKCPKDMNKKEDPKVKVLLTKKEHKKLRRMNRREAWKERQEKIRLGLEPPPEPKVRMANLMRVLGTEAVLDPTKMEKHVREQMAKRLKAHEDANKARKLTPEQRKDKKIRKLTENTTTGVNVCLYRVTDLSNGSHKFKLETNAKQLFMTGTVVLFKDVNVVVMEGGPKQQKKFKRLMMERIKWVEESRRIADVQPKCELIWEGMVPDRSFGEIQFKSCPSELFARDHFLKHGVEHYWDLCYGRKVLEEAEDGG